ncbi:polymorphic toxin-type HINT domain-containing protein [Leptospira interrogans]|uniref:polymorphic toxin-type HINT domain-containing protein n=1 Tax=Leptospira interrogans TaxID=173 RepID=UPI0009E62F5B|nr:polymorphic toxin-type HINT domain-containing protein [Leptospira interrogans]
MQKRNAEETASLSSQWVKVEDLKLRDQVLRSDGSWGTVTGIYYYNTEPTKVYNLEVEDNHTYVVGGDVFGIGYVVHNYQGDFDKGVKAVQKELEGLFGKRNLFGIGPENPVGPQAEALYHKIGEYGAKDSKLGGEKNQLATEGKRLEGQRELFARKNGLLVEMVRNTSSNGVEGIAELRKSLLNADPKRGFSKSEMNAIGAFMKKNFGNNDGLGMSFGGSGFLKSGMNDFISNGGIKSELLKAASEAGSSGVLVNLNEKLATNQEQLRKKTIEHEKAGAELAILITKDFEALKVAASEKHYNDPKYSDFLAKNQKNGIKLESPSSYMANEGKRIQAEHQSKLEFIQKYGEVDKHGSNGKIVAEQLLNSRERYVNSDLKREEMTNRLLSKNEVYQEKSALFEKSGKEAERLRTQLEERRSVLGSEGKTERQIASDSAMKKLNDSLTTVTKERNTTKSEIERLYKNTLLSVDSKTVYGPEVYAAALKNAQKDPVYSENLKKLHELKQSKETSIRGLLEKLTPDLKLGSETNARIAELENKNREIVDTIATRESKDGDKESSRLGKSGLAELDKTISKSLDAEMRKIVDRNYIPETGLFKEKGPLAHLNNPKIVEEAVTMANNFDFGDTKLRYQPSPEKVAKIAERVVLGYTNAETKNPDSKKLSIAEVERLSSLAFESPADRFKRAYGVEYNPNDVDHKIKLATEMVSARNGNQSQFGPLAVQLSGVFENIVQKSGGKKENFQPDPSMKPGSKEYKDFEKVRDWIFSGKNPMEMGNATSEALCRVFYNYNQALLTGKVVMDTNLSTFMTHKIRNGLVSMGVDNPAPVYDNGGTSGYSKYAKPETRLDNDFGRYLVDKKGNPLGITGVMSPASVTKIVENLPEGAVVQIFGDTRNPPGPNHYFFAIKGKDGSFYQFNNNGLFNEPVDWEKMKVYGLYYD